MTPADAAAAMSNFHPETVSFTLKYVSTSKAAYILSNIDTDKAAYAFGMADFVSQDNKLSSFTSAQLAAIVVKMDPAKTAGIVANEKLSVEDAVTILGAVKARNEPAAQNILAELDKLDAGKSTRIRDALGMHILGTAVADFDLDGSGGFDFQDVKYLFDNMGTLSVEKADFNHNGRIDFSDVVLMHNKLQEVNNTFSLTVGTGGLEYRLSSDGKSVTTAAVGMGLHTSPLTMDYANGTISYIPYPNSWDDESKRVSVTKAGDPAQYAELSNRMVTSILTVLTRYDSTLTEEQKTQLNNALARIRENA
jgi:flagellar motility protein MotE (MotC chaperone)